MSPPIGDVVITISVPLIDAPASTQLAARLIRELEARIANPHADASVVDAYLERARNAFIGVLGEVGPLEERLASWLRSGGCRGGFAYIFMPVATNDEQRVFATILRLLIVGQTDRESKFRREWIAEQLNKANWYKSIIVETLAGPCMDWEPIPTPSSEQIREMIDGEIQKANEMMQMRTLPSAAVSILEALKATVAASSTLAMKIDADDAVLQGKRIELAAAEHRFLSAIAMSPDLSASSKELGLENVPPMVSRLRRKFEENGWSITFLAGKGFYQLRSIGPVKTP